MAVLSRLSVPQQGAVWPFHVLALVISIVWSTTFVATKVLLQSGMTPETIFLTRFTIAYILIWLISRGPLFADNWRDEALLALAGITGGSLYFLTENTALKYTYATNVSILISAAPLMTIALSSAVFHKRMPRMMLAGSGLALIGVVFVVLNGSTDVHVSPLGDLLTLAAAACWAVYSVVLKMVGNGKYSTFFVTRKVFFYGLVFMLLYMPFSGVSYDFSLLAQPQVWGNLLFLGIVASLVCFVAWNKAMDVIGPDKANNYIYLTPVGTITTAVIVLHEPLSWMAILGAVITVSGVILAEKSR